MPALANAKHEIVAQERFKGASWWRAAETAGFTRHSVQSLQRVQKIKIRIAELNGAPMEVGGLIRMWRELYDAAIKAKHLTAASNAARQITLLSDFPVKAPTYQSNYRPKAKIKAKREQQPAPAEAEEEDHENVRDPDAPAAPNVQTLDRLLGRLDNDTRDLAKAEEVGLAPAEPAKDTRGDYRHE
jgi:hypothetical protein